MAYQFPHGVNGSAARAVEDPRLRVYNPFAIPHQPTSNPASPTSLPISASPIPGSAVQQSASHPSASGFAHGSAELGASTTSRGRSRDREARRSRTASQPRTPQRSVQEQVEAEEVQKRLDALEGLAVTHAHYIKQVHDDVQGLLHKFVGVEKYATEIKDKIGSLDTYAQNVDSRISAVRGEAATAFNDLEKRLTDRVMAIENLVRNAASAAPAHQPAQHVPATPPISQPPGVGQPERFNLNTASPSPPPPEFHTRVDGPRINTAFQPQNQPFQHAFAPAPNYQGPGLKDVLSEFRINRKDCDLKKFTGKMADFKMWKKRLIDHCSGSTGRWKGIFRMCEECDSPITKSYLETLHIGGGYSAWALAEDLENFIVKCISDDLYERREAWTMGEDGNGFELYRNLFQEFEGGSTLVRMGGRKLLNSFGRPARGEDVQKHYEEWQVLLNKFGADLIANPEECYYRALEVVPTEFEEEIIMKPEIQTMQDIYRFVTRKTLHHKHLAQQKALLQSRGRRPVAELKELSLEDIVAQTVAAVQKSNPRNSPGPKTEGANQQRTRSPGPAPGKFWFDKDCWFCGANGHQKRDCKQLQKVIADNGGVRPKGLKGAFEKAKEAWLKEHRPRSKSPRSLKPLISEDPAPVDSDDESDLQPLGSMVCTSVFGLRCIECNDSDVKMPPKPESEIIVESEEDVDKVLKLFACAEPEPTKQCATPDSRELKKGEKWCMMDSGAGCHAADAKKEFPLHKRRKGKQVRKCVLANGDPMESDEVVDVRAGIQGETHEIEFDNLPVECPIISVRKIVRKGNKVVFQERGGYIHNLKTNKRLHFVEKNGVYFIKILVHPPPEDFHRRGR